MQRVAQSWLVLHLTGSGVALGFVSALQFLPMLVLGAWGGLLADRTDKRRVLMVTQALIGLLALVLGAVILASHVQLWMVYAVAFLLGLVTAIDNPARQSFVMEMVGRRQLTNAVSLKQRRLHRRPRGRAGGGRAADHAGRHRLVLRPQRPLLRGRADRAGGQWTRAGSSAPWSRGARAASWSRACASSGRGPTCASRWSCSASSARWR